MLLAQLETLLKTADKNIDAARDHGPVMWLLMIGIVIAVSSWGIRFFWIDLPERNARIKSQEIHDQCAVAARDCFHKLVVCMKVLCDDNSDIRKLLNFAGSDRLRTALEDAQTALDESNSKWSEKARRKKPDSDE